MRENTGTSSALSTKLAWESLRLPSLDEMIRRTVLRLLDGITRGFIMLADADELFALGRPGDPLNVNITVHDPAAYRAILFGGSVGAGESYVTGDWSCDDLAKLAEILASNVGALDRMERGAARFATRLRDTIATLTKRNTRDGSKRNIAYHYDLSNDLFAQFLDE